MWDLIGRIALPRRGRLSDGVGGVGDAAATAALYQKLKATTGRLAGADANKDGQVTDVEQKAAGITTANAKDAADIAKAKLPELDKVREVLTRLQAGQTLTSNDIQALEACKNAIAAKLKPADIKATNLAATGAPLQVTGVKPTTEVQAGFVNKHPIATKLAAAQDAALTRRINDGDNAAKAQLAMQTAIAEYGSRLSPGDPDYGAIKQEMTTALSDSRSPLFKKMGELGVSYDMNTLIQGDRKAAVDGLVKQWVDNAKQHGKPFDAQGVEKLKAFAGELRDAFEQNPKVQKILDAAYPTGEAKALRNEIQRIFSPDIAFTPEKAKVLQDPHRDPAQSIVDLAELLKQDFPNKNLEERLVLATQVRSKVNEFNQNQIEAKARDMYTELKGDPSVFEVKTLSVGNMARSSGIPITDKLDVINNKEFVGLFNNNYDKGTIRTTNGGKEVAYDSYKVPTPSFEKLVELVKRKDPALGQQLNNDRTQAGMQANVALVKQKYGSDEKIGALVDLALTTSRKPSFVLTTAGAGPSTYTMETTKGTLDKHVQTSITLKPMGVDSREIPPDKRAAELPFRPTVDVKVGGQVALQLQYHQDKAGNIVAEVIKPKPTRDNTNADGSIKLGGGMSFDPKSGVLDFGKEKQGADYTIGVTTQARNSFGDSDDFSIIMTKTRTPVFTVNAQDPFDQDKITVKKDAQLLSDADIKALAGALSNGGSLEFTELKGGGVNPDVKQRPNETEDAYYSRMRVSNIDVDTSSKDVKIKIHSFTDPVRSKVYANTAQDAGGNIALSQDRSVASALDIVARLKDQVPAAVKAKLETLEAELKRKLINPPQA